MYNIHEERDRLLKEHTILITCFSFKIGEQVCYRFYFKQISTGYLYNPLFENEVNKRYYPYYTDHDEGLTEMIKQANEYLDGLD